MYMADLFGRSNNKLLFKGAHQIHVHVHNVCNALDVPFLFRSPNGYIACLSGLFHIFPFFEVLKIEKT